MPLVAYKPTGAPKGTAGFGVGGGVGGVLRDRGPGRQPRPGGGKCTETAYRIFLVPEIFRDLKGLP